MLYRCRLAADAPWIFLCKACWDRAAPGNPGYTYGGTWKAHPKR